MNTWQKIVSFADQIPSDVWAALMVTNIALAIATWRVAQRWVRRAGERAAHPEHFRDASRKDTALTVASLVPAALFWGMVLAGSFRGLVAFGRTVLDWNGGAEYLVPGTLDGVSIKRIRSPTGRHVGHPVYRRRSRRCQFRVNFCGVRTYIAGDLAVSGCTLRGRYDPASMMVHNPGREC